MLVTAIVAIMSVAVGFIVGVMRAYNCNTERELELLEELNNVKEERDQYRESYHNLLSLEEEKPNGYKHR